MNKLDDLKEKIGFDLTFDFFIREIKLDKGTLYLIFNSCLIDSLKISIIIVSINQIKTQITSTTFDDLIEENLCTEKLIKVKNLDEMALNILSGDLGIIYDYSEAMFTVETKLYPARSISEPDSEKVVRGSRDGLTENLITNLGLIRRRLKNGNLAMKLYQIGKESKTNVALIYLDNIINPECLNNIDQKLSNLKINELTMSDKALEELLLNSPYTSYPLIKYTERPDTLVMHLYQGMFGIVVDTSPSAIIGPVTLFDHLQHAEEYRQTIVAGSYLRLIRLLGIILAFFSLPLWYALACNYNIMPGFLQTFLVNEPNHFKLFFQIILIEVGIELIRMASIHTPNALSSSMGLIVGIIIGDMAVKVGLFNEQIVLLGAVSAIGTYITPSYELSLANKMAKIFMIIMVWLFEISGLIISFILLIIYLCTLKSFNRPYLYPLIPFNFKALIKQLFRLPYHQKEQSNK